MTSLFSCKWQQQWLAFFLCASTRLNCSRVLTVVRTPHDPAWIEQLRMLSHFYSDMGSNKFSKVHACISQNFKSVLCLLKQKICFKQVFCYSENNMWEMNTFKLEIPVRNKTISNDINKSCPPENCWLLPWHTSVATQHFMMLKRHNLQDNVLMPLKIVDQILYIRWNTTQSHKQREFSA